MKDAPRDLGGGREVAKEKTWLSGETKGYVGSGCAAARAAASVVPSGSGLLVLILSEDVQHGWVWKQMMTRSELYF